MAWIFYWKEVDEAKMEEEKMKSKTYQQIKKELKKKGDGSSPKLTKKQFKELGHKALAADEKSLPEIPSIFNVKHA